MSFFLLTLAVLLEGQLALFIVGLVLSTTSVLTTLLRTNGSLSQHDRFFYSFIFNFFSKKCAYLD